MTPKITQICLYELLIYDPFTGEFRWRIYRHHWARAGDLAGHIAKTTGYLMLCLDGKRLFGHRVAWFYMTGVWPKDDIDHEDLDRANNRWLNLREATRSQNQMNTGTQKNNRLGIKGVHLQPNGKFTAQIGIAGKNTYLGTFPTADEAKAAYDAAANQNFGSFARSA